MLPKSKRKAEPPNFWPLNGDPTVVFCVTQQSFSVYTFHKMEYKVVQSVPNFKKWAKNEKTLFTSLLNQVFSFLAHFLSPFQGEGRVKHKFKSNHAPCKSTKTNVPNFVHLGRNGISITRALPVIFNFDCWLSFYLFSHTSCIVLSPRRNTMQLTFHRDSVLPRQTITQIVFTEVVPTRVHF